MKRLGFWGQTHPPCWVLILEVGVRLGLAGTTVDMGSAGSCRSDNGYAMIDSSQSLPHSTPALPACLLRQGLLAAAALFDGRVCAALTQTHMPSA